MSHSKKMKTGIVGAALAALCCFTPVLVIGLGAVGLSAWVGWLDYVLFPVMFASMGFIAYTLYLRSDKAGPKPHGVILVVVIALTALLLWLDFRFAIRISVATAVSVAAYAYYLRSAVAKRVVV